MRIARAVVVLALAVALQGCAWLSHERKSAQPNPFDFPIDPQWKRN